MPSFDTFKKWVVADYRAHADWRAQARDDFRFIAGDQWTEEEKQALADMQRPVIVFNRSAVIINSVVGSEINNRTEVRYFPRTLGDAEPNEQLSKGAEWFRDQSGAEEEDSQAFYDTVVCGLGWTEARMDFEDDAEGAPMMERINPLEMGWDASAERRGLTDARRIFRVRQMSTDTAMEMFEGKDRTALDAKWLDIHREESAEEPGRQWSDDDYDHVDESDEDADSDKDEVTIVQLQYCERVKFVEYVDPVSGRKGEMPKRQFGKMMGELRDKFGIEPQFTSRDVSRKRWRQVFLGAEILEENEPCPDGATFVPITGYWDQAKCEWYGLLRQMRDPQRYANKWLSQSLHIINSNSKGGVIIDKDAVDDHAEFEENWSAADSVIWTNPGAMSTGKITPKPMAQMPAALMQLTEFAISSIRDVSGVNQELLGLRDQNQPGVLEYQRKQAAMTTLATLFDALRQYRKQQGKVLLYYMLEFMNDGRLIRIVDENGTRYESLQVDPGLRKYDVIVDDAPSSPNTKERTWEVIMAMLPIIERAGLPKELLAELLEYSPFPTALVEKVKAFAQKPQEPDPMKMAMLKLAMEKEQAEIGAKQAAGERDRANAVENMAQALYAMSKAQAEPELAQYEILKDMAQAEGARIKSSVDAQKADVDLQKAHLDLAGKVVEASRPKETGNGTNGRPA